MSTPLTTYGCQAEIRSEKLPMVDILLTHLLWWLQGPIEDEVVALLRRANEAIISEYKSYTDEEKKKVRAGSDCISVVDDVGNTKLLSSLPSSHVCG